VESLVPVYHKTNVTSLQSFLRGKFASWASNGSCVDDDDDDNDDVDVECA